MDEKPKTHGRGRLIELLKKQMSLSEGRIMTEPAEVAGAVSTSQETDKSSETSHLRIGKGRGDFLMKIRSQSKKESTVTASSSVSVFKTSSSQRSPFADEEIAENLQSISFQDDFSIIGKNNEERDFRGRFGDQAKSSTNYVALKTDPSKVVYQYLVNFQPSVDYSSYRFKILYEHFHDRKGKMCFDGGSVLFIPEKITQSSLVFKSKHPGDDSEVVMTIELVKKVDLKQCAALYNILFKNCYRAMNMMRFGNKFYNHQTVQQIPQHKLEIWPGYVTSVEEFDGGILLQCDIHHRVLRTETPYDILVTLVNRGLGNVKNLAEKELLGACVLTRYNNNLYRIDDISWSQSPESKFKLASGEEITFLQYYKKQYNLDIKDPKQPLLVHMEKKRGANEQHICLVPELCYMTGLTENMRKDMKVMKDISMYTRVTPAQREYAYKKFIDNIKKSEEARIILDAWGLTISDEPLRIDSRHLGFERIIFGNKKVYEQTNGDWNVCFRDAKVFSSVNIKCWVFVYPLKDARKATAFESYLRKTGPAMGIDIYQPKSVQLRDDRIETYLQALRNSIDESTQIVVCLCSTMREDRYAAIKKFCCKERPVPSQIILTTTLGREDRFRNIVQNVALQMNNKLGGASWAVRIPYENTMICGMDTYHGKNQKSASVGGFVASLNRDYTQWYSKTVIQGPKEELINGLVQAFIAALKYYLKINFTLPERIIVFRDGVGYGEMEVCLNFEVKQYIEACRKIGFDYNPKFAFVVVHKRIHSRFFEVSKNNGPLENPKPGKVIDHTITRKNYFDFYLVSQYVRSGTASPSHYLVIYDNSNLNPDHLQRLTYKFCHLYYNWPGTVRVPAPCQYAHKLAYLVGQIIRAVPHESLDNKLYYL